MCCKTKSRLALSIASCAIGETNFQVAKEKKWTLHQIDETQKPQQLKLRFNICGMWILQKRKTCKHIMWFHMCDCKILDSSVQVGFPKKNWSEGEMGIWNIWIPQCHIRILYYTYMESLLYFININTASTGHNFFTLQIRKAESSILKIKPRFHIRGMQHTITVLPY